MRISIITVSLNAEKTIEATLQSVLNQTYPNIEYIVIDGNSSDKTVEIVESYENKIDYFISENDDGIYHAMNKGVSASTGDIIFFLNADDSFADKKVVEDVLSVFSEKDHIDIIYGNQIFDNGSKQSTKKQSFSISRKQLAEMTIQHQTIFARIQCFNKSKAFSTKYKIVSDYDWILKSFLIKKFSSLYIDRDISIMSTQGISWTQNFEKERRLAMKKYFSDFEIIMYRSLPRLKNKLKKLFFR